MTDAERREQAKRLFDEAYRLQLKGGFEQAAAKYRASIELHPAAHALLRRATSQMN